MRGSKQSVLHLVPKSTFYNSKKEIIEKSLKMHEDLFLEDRELYTYLLYFVNSTYYSKSIIVEKLLSNSIMKEENKKYLLLEEKMPEIEEALILKALFNENITHALKLLLRLKEEKVNNNRTKKIITRFIFDRGNADFISIKYKKKIKSLLIHSLGLKTVNDILRWNEEGIKAFNKNISKFNNPYAKEVFYFVFDKEYEFKSEYLSEYVQVRKLFKDGNITSLNKTNLPIEVLDGFNKFYKRNISIEGLIAKGNISEKQKIQMQNRIKRSSDNIEIKIDFNNYSIIELIKYLYSQTDLTEETTNVILSKIDEKSIELRNKIKDTFLFDLSETAIILDCSQSSFGSKESGIMNPFFKNYALSKIFESEENIFYVGGEKNERGLLIPSGNTDLSIALINSVKAEFKNIIVLSDGFENVGSFEKVLEQLKKIGVMVNVMHFNPVFSPKNFAFKTLGDNILTLPFSSEKDIEDLTLFYLLNTNPSEFKIQIKNRILSSIK